VLTQENAYLQAEIDSLNSQIVEQTKVTRVEEVATKKYGMVYPTSDNCIVIDESEESSSNLAAEIRSQAYN
jgi:cell division protein FtsL